MGGGSKINLATFMRDKRVEQGEAEQAGPFITISRQYGTSGYFLGQLLVDLLSTSATKNQPWRVYSHEILDHVAEETDVAAEVLDRLRRERPRLMVDFFRNISGKKVPGGLEVRNRIANVVRGLAYEGNVIIIGVGGAGATADLPNGLRLRLEAPLEWRVGKIVENEGISPVKARLLLKKREKEREQLREIYNLKFKRQPPFDLVYDCSTFSLAQIAQHVVAAMKLKKMV